jgi:hypothetical protein
MRLKNLIPIRQWSALLTALAAVSVPTVEVPAPGISP